jgi:hypothetical protein
MSMMLVYCESSSIINVARRGNVPDAPALTRVSAGKPSMPATTNHPSRSSPLMARVWIEGVEKRYRNRAMDWGVLEAAGEGFTARLLRLAFEVKAWTSRRFKVGRWIFRNCRSCRCFRGECGWCGDVGEEDAEEDPEDDEEEDVEYALPLPLSLEGGKVMCRPAMWPWSLDDPEMDDVRPLALPLPSILGATCSSNHGRGGGSRVRKASSKSSRTTRRSSCGHPSSRRMANCSQRGYLPAIKRSSRFLILLNSPEPLSRPTPAHDFQSSGSPSSTTESKLKHPPAKSLGTGVP